MPENPDLIVDQLRRHLSWHAQALRASVGNAKMAVAEREALLRLANDPATPVALRYAELLVEGEAMREAPNVGERLALSRRLRGRRTEEEARHHGMYEVRAVQARRAAGGSERFVTAVLRLVTGPFFTAAAEQAARECGLPAGELEEPSAELWRRWCVLRPELAAELPDGVKGLLAMDAAEFRRAVEDDARGNPIDDGLAHFAVVERWAAVAGSVEQQLYEARGHLGEGRTAHLVATHGGRVDWQACQAYARAGARRLQAGLRLAELRAEAVAAYHQPDRQEERARCHALVLARLAARFPGLGETVLDALAAHRARCRSADCLAPGPECVAEVARLAYTRLPEHLHDELQQKPEPAPADPAPQLVTGDDTVFVCETALHGLRPERAHTVAVVVARSTGTAGLFGYAWLTEAGELRTGADQGAGHQDGALHAMCQAVLDLDDGSTPIHVVGTDRSAVEHLAQQLAAADPATPRFAVTERTLALAGEVRARAERVTVAADRCPEPHESVQAAGHLARMALRSASGFANSRTLQAEADRISQRFSNRCGTPPVAPGEETDRAHWAGDTTPTSATGVLAWRCALTRTHLADGWCPLPDGPLGDPHDGAALRLHLAHDDGALGGTEHQVTLRRRFGRWRLDGVRWPRGVLPGTLVTVQWQPGTPAAQARTRRLGHPDRVDGVEYRHRYDIHVVTRENAPGAEQDRRTPDLSDASWVLRTLRVLGYLSFDGTATLAEHALLRNALDLGMPQHRAQQLPKAVEQLIRSHQLERVLGSVDRHGRPWWPARAGHPRVELLRYVPDVQRVDEPEHGQGGGWGASRRAHMVAGFVRRLPSGAYASDEQIALHREAVHAAEIVDRPLPEGYTYVRRHHRGRALR